MGIPSFFRWLVDKYPKVVVSAVEEPGDDVDTSLPNPNGMEFDNLYLDMNSIIHPCFHPDDQLFPPTTFEEVFKAIFEYVDQIFRIVRPRKLLYMAIDGSAPRAKLNQQRARRFQAAKNFEIEEAAEEQMRREFEREGKTLLPKCEHEVSDPGVITPGTVFMGKLSKALEYYIRLRLNSDPGWKSIKVILSDANVPGEGEHKIMAFIRLQRSHPGYNPNLHHCLYGLDADLIMLGLATREIHFSILREDVLKAEQSEICLSSLPKEFKTQWNKSSNVSPKMPYQFLNIWTLREYLELDMNIPEFKIDVERLIDDFIFICLFLGNDFLPQLPSLEIREGAIDLMIYVYKKMFKKLGGYLVDVSKINDKKATYIKVKRVERFILEVGSYEDKIFDKRNRLRQRKLQWFLQERLEEENDGNDNYVLQYDIKYGIPNEMVEAENGAYKFSVQNKSSNFRSSETISKSFKEKCNVSAPQNLLAVGHDGNDVIKNTKELKQKVKDFLHYKVDSFKNGPSQNDKVNLGSPGWKARYYREKFSAETTNEIEIARRSIVEKYAEGLCWILQYYFARLCSWSWYFPFYHGPFASDLKGLSCSQIKFKFGCPFKPFDHLMAVLSPKSSHALPKAYRPLINSKDSKIIKFYPSDFDVDMDGKRFTWQGVCKLPFIIEEELLAETRMLERELETITEADIVERKLWHEYEGSRQPHIYNQRRYATKVEAETHLKPTRGTYKGSGSSWRGTGWGRGFVAKVPVISPGHVPNNLTRARSFGRGRGTLQEGPSTTRVCPVVNARNAS